MSYTYIPWNLCLTSPSQGAVTTSSDESDDDWHNVGRGRSASTSTVKGPPSSTFLRAPSAGANAKRASSRHPPSSSGASGSDSPHLHQRRTDFTRSRARSPAVATFAHAEDSAAQVRLAAMIARHQSLKVSHWLPARWRTSMYLPFIGVCTFSVDAKVAAESLVLLISLAGIRRCLGNVILDVHDVWIQRGKPSSK
jgi:hypothetical protein